MNEKWMTETSLQREKPLHAHDLASRTMHAGNTSSDQRTAMRSVRSRLPLVFQADKTQPATQVPLSGILARIVVQASCLPLPSWTSFVVLASGPHSFQKKQPRRLHHKSLFHSSCNGNSTIFYFFFHKTV
jgi:hypothetical protein